MGGPSWEVPGAVRLTETEQLVGAGAGGQVVLHRTESVWGDGWFWLDSSVNASGASELCTFKWFNFYVGSLGDGKSDVMSIFTTIKKSKALRGSLPRRKCKGFARVCAHVTCPLPSL